MITKETREAVNEILDDSEKLAVQMFYDNEKQREAVRKVLLMPMYYQGVLKKGKKANMLNNWACSGLQNNNENLGAVVRAVNMGINFIDDGFDLLSTFKKEEEEPNEPSKNPAR